MDGITINGITLYFGEIPQRKQMAVYFQEGTRGYVVAYVSPKHEARARECWQKMLDGVVALDTQERRRRFIEGALNGTLPDHCDPVEAARMRQADIKARTIEVNEG